MLVVISDLHLVHSDQGFSGSLEFNKNLEPSAYQRFINRLIRESKNNQATHLDLVLAGDIFEMFKSPIWYENEERPYVHLDTIEPHSSMESKILRLLDNIAEEEHVGETLEIFRGLGSYFDFPVKLHYIVGNHDRIVNATPATRRKVRLMLGLADDDSYLPHTHIYSPDGRPIAFIRHGHEYDHDNFALNLSRTARIPQEFPREVYDAPPLGDFLALEFGNKLLYLFTQTYGPYAIKNNENLRNLYVRLAHFDDVRPLSAMLHYLMTPPNLTPKEALAYLEPIFIEVLDLMGENRFFLKELKTYDPTGGGSAGAISNLLRLRPWRKGIPFWLIWRIARFISRNPSYPESGSFAGREEVLFKDSGAVRCVISGHTHTPEVSVLNSKDGIERYHINTGTWRNVVPTSRDKEFFGRIKALAYAAVYGPGENPGKSESGQDPLWSFDYWSGFSQKFYPQTAATLETELPG